MRYEELKYDGKVIKNQKDITKILKENKLNWLIDSEIESSKLEIIKDTLIWHDGSFNLGKWKYGIFKNGSFNGTWESGIFEPSESSFKGKWIDGVNFWESEKV